MLRAVALRCPKGLLARAMSSKLVATVTGPADKDALSTFTRTVMGQGVTLGSSRSMEVSGTLSIASVLFLPDKLAEKGAIESVSALQWALQANLAGFICSVRPARVGRASRVIARVHVTGAERMGILAELASHCESRGVRVATMRTQTDSSRYGADGIEGNDDDDEPLYTCVCTLATNEVRPAPLKALGVTPGPKAGRRGSSPPATPSPLGLLCTPPHPCSATSQPATPTRPTLRHPHPTAPLLHPPAPFPRCTVCLTAGRGETGPTPSLVLAPALPAHAAPAPRNPHPAPCTCAPFRRTWMPSGSVRNSMSSATRCSSLLKLPPYGCLSVPPRPPGADSPGSWLRYAHAPGTSC